MKIACLQLAPSLGEVEANIRRADALLSTASSEELRNLDLLVLPELAFTGYNFPSLEAITPFLEPTVSGVSTRWAKTTAARLNCVVILGYPEDAAAAPSSLQPRLEKSAAQVAPEVGKIGYPVVPNASPDFPFNFNASVAVSPSGAILAHYRKSFLYYTDATWAREGSGFWAGTLPLPRLNVSSLSLQDATSGSMSASQNGTEINTAIGICMDLNPYNFTSPWDSFEFANHVLGSEAELIIANMAWLSQQLSPEMIQGDQASVPDTYTIAYWIERFSPLLDKSDGRLRVLVLANRCGMEGDVCYAGTSTVIGIRDGQAWMWDFCGKGEERLCIADTNDTMVYNLKKRQKQVEDDVADGSEEDESSE